MNKVFNISFCFISHNNMRGYPRGLFRRTKRNYGKWPGNGQGLFEASAEAQSRP